MRLPACVRPSVVVAISSACLFVYFSSSADGEDGQATAENSDKSSTNWQVADFLRGVRDHNSSDYNGAISNALEQVGPDNLEDVPAIAAAMPALRRGRLQDIVKVIEKVGPEAVPKLVQTAKNSSSANERFGAIIALGLVHVSSEQSNSVVAVFTEALDESNYMLSLRAAESLRKFSPTSPQAVQAAIDAKSSRYVHVRRNAVSILESSNAKSTIPSLIALLDDDDVSVRIGACVALGQFGPEAKESVPSITSALKNEHRSLREVAKQSLRLISPDEALRILGEPYDPVEERRAAVGALMIDQQDWPQLGGSRYRNNTPAGHDIPTTWNPGKFDRRTGEWLADEAKNIKWVAQLGSQTYGNPVVADGNMFVGTNNGAGYLKRYPADIDLGCLLCFRESDGKFLWQHSSEKLATGRVNDWPLQGICSSPTVERDRLWFVTNRGEVRCLDADGFHDGKNDGPFKDEPFTSKDEADVVWVYNMMTELGVFQHNMATCAPTIWHDVLFICTSNGVDNSHNNIPAPDAPSFIALHKRTGELLWKDNSPGNNILHGQWSCPVVGIFNDVPQVIFPGGDGWVYSFRADRWKDGKPELLWKFDCNSKTSKWILGGRGTRNNIIAYPVIYDGLVYIAVGQDPEHGEGMGHLWCIDPTCRGDVSAELVMDGDGKTIPHRRLQAATDWEQVGGVKLKDWHELEKDVVSQPLRGELEKLGIALPEACAVAKEIVGGGWLLTAEMGDKQVQYRIANSNSLAEGDVLNVQRRTEDFLFPNPNSAVVWHYGHWTQEEYDHAEFEEQMHRTLGSPVIKNDILVIAETSGLVHCLNAKTGEPYWKCDCLAACWSTPMIVEDKVYVADEDGDVAIFSLSPDPSKSVDNELFPLHEINMGNSIYTVPVVANNVLYIANRTHLYAIEAMEDAKP